MRAGDWLVDGLPLQYCTQMVYLAQWYASKQKNLHGLHAEDVLLLKKHFTHDVGFILFLQCRSSTILFTALSPVTTAYNSYIIIISNTSDNVTSTTSRCE